MYIDDDRVTHVLVSLTEIPMEGNARALVLLQHHHRELVKDAARVAGMSLQKFMRAVLVNAAEKVLKEAGIK